jgi:hypothetical protein
MDKLFFAIETFVDSQYCSILGRSLIDVLIKRLEELARDDKIDQEDLRYWALETLPDFMEKLNVKEASVSSYSRAVCDETASPELVEELRQKHNNAKEEFQDALICLKTETLNLLRAK